MTTCEPPSLVVTGRHAMRYIKETGGEARHNASLAMTATLIQQESETFFTLTTEKGKEIGVCFWPWGRITVYIQCNGMSGLSMGRQFGSLEEAAAAYRWR